MREKGGKVRCRGGSENRDGAGACGGTSVISEGSDWGIGAGDGGLGSGGTVGKPLGARAALVGRVAVPANLVVGVRGVTEIPGGTVVNLGVPDDKASGIGSRGGLEVASEGGEIGRRAGAAVS